MSESINMSDWVKHPLFFNLLQMRYIKNLTKKNSDIIMDYVTELKRISRDDISSLSILYEFEIEVWRYRKMKMTYRKTHPLMDLPTNGVKQQSIRLAQLLLLRIINRHESFYMPISGGLDKLLDIFDLTVEDIISAYKNDSEYECMDHDNLTKEELDLLGKFAENINQLNCC